MLRETRAKWLALGTATLVALMALAFAALRNAAPVQRKPAPPITAPAPKPAPVAPAVDPARRAAQIETGRQAFERLHCIRCHAAEGKGNRDSPLDGIGARMDRAELHAWSTGSGVARDYLPASVARRKGRIADDPDMPALVEYLAQLK